MYRVMAAALILNSEYGKVLITDREIQNFIDTYLKKKEEKYDLQEAYSLFCYEETEGETNFENVINRKKDTLRKNFNFPCNNLQNLFDNFVDRVIELYCNMFIIN